MEVCCCLEAVSVCLELKVVVFSILSPSVEYSSDFYWSLIAFMAQVLC